MRCRERARIEVRQRGVVDAVDGAAWAGVAAVHAGALACPEVDAVVEHPVDAVQCCQPEEKARLDGWPLDPGIQGVYGTWGDAPVPAPFHKPISQPCAKSTVSASHMINKSKSFEDAANTRS